MKEDTLHILFSTFPDEATARRVALALVEERVVACAQVLPGIHSIYHWQGKLETSAEVMVVFKLAGDSAGAMERIKELHPYEVPEMVAIRAEAVWPAYLAWARGEMREG